MYCLVYFYIKFNGDIVVHDSAFLTYYLQLILPLPLFFGIFFFWGGRDRPPPPPGYAPFASSISAENIK